MTAAPGRPRRPASWVEVRLLVSRTLREYLDDNCPDLAAGISYYVLFSVFPLAILAVSVAGAVLEDPALREGAVRWVLSTLPLVPGTARGEISAVLEGVARGATVSGVAGVLGLAWSASAVMGSLRWALDQAWDVRTTRHFLLGKLLDGLMVVLVGLLLALSLGATLLVQVADRLGGRLLAALGPIGAAARHGFDAVALAVPFAFTFATFVLVYRVLPSVRTRLADVWPAALLAALLFEAVKVAFTAYVSAAGGYDRVYGALGAVVAFQAFVYLEANVLLLGAEMASEWARLFGGVHGSGGPPPGEAAV